MKRIALVHPRYGLEISGGSETYARKIAEHLANRYEVEVLTTKAVDSATWKDWYVRDVETIHGSRCAGSRCSRCVPGISRRLTRHTWRSLPRDGRIW